MTDYTSYVNIKQGTFSEPRFSYGNTLPLVASPYGMNSFCIQTKASDEGWYFHPSHRQTEGIRLTHQPSPWVRDYGHFVFMPQSGDVYVTENERTSGYKEICLNPAYIEMFFKRYRASMSVTPSERGAVIKTRWETDATPRFALLPFNFPTSMSLDVENGELTGYINAYGDGTRRDFKMYFCMKFDKPVIADKTVITKCFGEKENGLSGEGDGVGINIAFDIPVGDELTVKLATSYVSVNSARASLQREIADKTYEDLKAETTAKWNEMLSKIEIDDTEERKRTFYSCFYRCFIFPRIFFEYDENGQPVHYSTKSGEIKAGVMCTDNGFWDTGRSLYPLLSLLIPEKVKEMIQGYLNFYKEEGWLPKWLSPGERGIMPGTLIDGLLADASVKNLLDTQQMELSLEGVIKNATTPSGTHLNGRVGVEDYVAKGYIPCDKYKESVNNSLDAYFCDFGISQIAKKLGKADISAEYKKRSENYKLLFDESVGFIRGLKEDGSRNDSFSPIRWGGEYCEGGPWQNGFAVYHDIDGLADLYGGKEGFEEKLDELFSTPPVFEVGSYNAEIHEMTEMSFADFGQCAISNQPSFHLPYLYSAIGHQDKTAYWIRKITSEAFNSSEKGFPGDEDNGSMGAWYVLSTLGFYQLCPGKPEYILGVCTAKSAKIKLGGKTLEIINNTSGDNSSIKVTVDGEDLDTQKISHEQLLSANTITFSN